MLNDILTNGSSSGIAWSIENVNNPSESWGYKSNTDKKINKRNYLIRGI